MIVRRIATTEANSICKNCKNMEEVYERFIYPSNAVVKYWFCKKRRFLFRNETDLAVVCKDAL
jgi:hypothetical protein